MISVVSRARGRARLTSWVLASLGIVTASSSGCGSETRDTTPASPGAAADAGTEASVAETRGPERPVVIGADGYFYLNGKKTRVVGVEEERNVLTDAQVDHLIPRLEATGVNFVVVYLQNLQSEYFYRRLGEHGIWVAQHLGTVKRETGSGFSNTGGVIGTIPDEAWLEARLEDLRPAVARLAVHRNILFWWLGGEFAEPEIHSTKGISVTRDHVLRYRDAVRALDPLRRPFTVSHHFVEVVESAVLPYIDYADLTDFAWFTVATHFHLGDFVPGGGWWPVAQASESPLLLAPILRRAHELNRGMPIFLGGWFGQAPSFGPCSADDQGRAMRETWAAISASPHVGFSAYHLDAWNDNAIPHALFTRSGDDWVPTAGGRALRDIIASP